MSDVYNLPPSPQGTTEQQLLALNDYLVRLSRQLNSASAEAKSDNVKVTSATFAAAAKNAGAEKKKDEDLPTKEQVSRLKDLVLKTSNVLEMDMKTIHETLTGQYVAISDFGTLTENITTDISRNAEAISTVTERVTTIDSELQTGISSIEKIRASMVQGFLTYNGTEYYGIAIGEEVKTTETTVVREGKTYSELSSDDQSIGIYTAKGWFFFINGQLVGAFNAEKGMLTVPEITVDTEIYMGRWQVSSSGTWGVRFIGGNT